MIASVHAGSISKNASHAEFHWPAAFILSQTGVAAVFGVRFTPIAFASSNRMGAPRLHVWIDRSDPIFRIIRISSRLAPASSAPRTCRRVPSGLKVRTRSIHRKADQLDVFAWQHAAGPRISGHLEALLDPLRVPFTKLRQRRVVPRTGGAVPGTATFPASATGAWPKAGSPTASMPSSDSGVCRELPTVHSPVL